MERSAREAYQILGLDIRTGRIRRKCQKNLVQAIWRNEIRFSQGALVNSSNTEHWLFRTSIIMQNIATLFLVSVILLFVPISKHTNF